MRDFRKLQVWQKSHELALDVYKSTVCFPVAEQYGLTNQIRRAAVSVPANIAEGCGRDTDRDFVRFLHISAGSANELEYHIQLASDLGYLADDSYVHLNDKVNEVERMLAGLIRSVQPKS